MPKMTFTDRQVRALPFPAKDDKPNEVQYFERLKEGRSLVLYVSYGGSKTWRVLFYEGGKPRTKRIGTYPELSIKDARRQVDKFDAEEAVAATKAGTFRDVAIQWLSDYVDKKQLRTSYEIRRQLDVYIYPKWGDRKIFEIDRADVNNLLRSIEKRSGAPMADYVLSTIRSIMTWYTVENKHYQPAVVPRMHRDQRDAQERTRKRILDDAEIRAVWKACDELGIYGALVRTLLLTGQRLGAVKSMKWADIVDGVWTIPEQRREKGHIGSVKLPKLVLTTINELPRIDGNEYVFAGNKSNQPINSFSRWKREIDEVLPKEIPEWRLHDLRRTARSLLARAGIPDHVAERTIGHRLQGVEAIYNRHPYFQEKTDALQKLANLIGMILHPPAKTNIVPMPKRARRAQARAG
jgi:integrase